MIIGVANDNGARRSPSPLLEQLRLRPQPALGALAPEVASIVCRINPHLHDYARAAAVQDPAVHLLAVRPVQYPRSWWCRRHGFVTVQRRGLLTSRLSGIPDSTLPGRREVAAGNAQWGTTMLLSILRIDRRRRATCGHSGGAAGR